MYGENHYLDRGETYGSISGADKNEEKNGIENSMKLSEETLRGLFDSISEEDLPGLLSEGHILAVLQSKRAFEVASKEDKRQAKEARARRPKSSNPSYAY